MAEAEVTWSACDICSTQDHMHGGGGGAEVICLACNISSTQDHMHGGGPRARGRTTCTAEDHVHGGGDGVPTIRATLHLCATTGYDRLRQVLHLQRTEATRVPGGPWTRPTYPSEATGVPRTKPPPLQASTQGHLSQFHLTKATRVPGGHGRRAKASYDRLRQVLHLNHTEATRVPGEPRTRSPPPPTCSHSPWCSPLYLHLTMRRRGCEGCRGPGLHHLRPWTYLHLTEATRVPGGAMDQATTTSYSLHLTYTSYTEAYSRHLLIQNI